MIPPVVDEQPQFPPSQPERLELVDVLLFLSLGAPVFFIVMAVAVLAVKLAEIQAMGARLILAQCAGYAATLPLLSWIIRMRHDVSAWSLIRLGVGLKEASTSVSMGVLTALGVAVTAALLKTPQLKTPMEDLLADKMSLIFAAVLGVTIVPFFEELLFRGLLQTLLRRYAPAAVAVVTSAVLFALLHGPQYAWSWRHVLLITAAGSAFGVRRIVTDSVGAAAVMHGSYNMVLFVALFAGKQMTI